MPNIRVPYKPRDAFLPFHNRTQKEAVMICHRQAGKTVAITNDLIRRCTSIVRSFPLPTFAWFYPTRVRAKDIAWKYIKHYSAPIPGVQVMESELSIQFANGGKVTLYGADNSRGVGLTLDGVYYDESDEIPARVVAEVAPTLSILGGFSVYAGMLKGRYNLWKRYSEAQGKPDVFTMMLRASESGIIAPSELKRLRDTMGEAAYEMQLECNANAAIANAIYGKEMDEMRKQGRITKLAVDPTVPLDFFFDIGHSLRGDDWTLWAIQLQGRDILVQEYYARTGEIPAHYAAKVLEIAAKSDVHVGTVFLPHDGNRQDRTGRTAKDDLEDAGIKRIKIVPRTPDIWTSINQLRALMARVYINQERCSLGWTMGELDMPSGIDCLDFYTKKEEATTGLILDVPVHNQYSHGADALRTFGEAYSQGMLEGTSVFAESAWKNKVIVSRNPSGPQERVSRRQPIRVTR